MMLSQNVWGNVRYVFQQLVHLVKEPGPSLYKLFSHARGYGAKQVLLVFLNVYASAVTPFTKDIPDATSDLVNRFLTRRFTKTDQTSRP